MGFNFNFLRRLFGSRTEIESGTRIKFWNARIRRLLLIGCVLALSFLAEMGFLALQIQRWKHFNSTSTSKNHSATRLELHKIKKKKAKLNLD